MHALSHLNLSVAGFQCIT